MRRVLLVLLALGAIPHSAHAQSTVGFADPADLGSLLAYRLPDWGYRTIDAALDLGGSGRSGEGNSQYAHTAESLAARWYGQSERHTWLLSGRQSGSWEWQQIERRGPRAVNHALSTNLTVHAESDRYFGENFAVIARADADASYRENSWIFDPSRVFAGRASVGAGWGRVRDVTPLLQARRVSERLVALGRPRLAPDEVGKLAAVFARRGGYSEVFDRPARRFWTKAFAALTAGGEPLTPYEVLYLADVVTEELGTRRQGWRVDLGASLEGIAVSGLDGQTQPGIVLNGVWSRNPNLNHQLTLSVAADYSWDSFSLRRSGHGYARVDFEHLWVLADRVFWTAGVQTRLIYTDSSERSLVNRDQSVRLATACRVYLENRLSLTTQIDAGWGRSGGTDRESRQDFRDWILSARLNYRLDNTLF